MNLKRCAALAALGVSLATAPASSEEVLRFATLGVPGIHLNVQMLHPWAALINERGKGVVQLDVRDGPAFANTVNYFDRIVNDVSQVSWGNQTVVTGKFVASSVTGLPLLAKKSEPASVAFWRTYKSGVFGSEYDDIEPLMLCVWPQAQLHLTKPIRSLDNLSGIKVVTGSRPLGHLVSALGGAPISLPLMETYSALQRGVADGTFMMYTAFEPFKLGEVTTYHVETELGSAGGMVFMMKKRFEALPEAARKVLTDNSGEAKTRELGRFWDSVEITGRNLVFGKPNHQFVTLSPAQQADWAKKAEDVAATWVKETPNGERVLAAFKAELAKAEAGR
jgi:TRAP-type C4-dicarboxylate transport system substrate-binding protein